MYLFEQELLTLKVLINHVQVVQFLSKLADTHKIYILMLVTYVNFLEECMPFAYTVSLHTTLVIVKPSRSVYFLDTLHILPESFVIICCLHPADYAKGFGGKYGVEKDKQDASAMGWDHHEAVEKHASQKGEDQETLDSGDIVRWDNDEETRYYR